MIVKITLNETGNPPGKLCDVELHFNDGDLKGLKLVGLAVWTSRSGEGRNVTWPSRQYTTNGEKRSFALLRPTVEKAQDHLRDRILAAYDEFTAEEVVRQARDAPE